MKKNRQRKRRLGIQYINPDRACSRCAKRPLHLYPNGTFSTYCSHCATVMRRKNMRKNRRKLFKAIQQGAPIPPCKLCKNAPRRVFPNSLCELCEDCRRAQQQKAKARRKLKREQAVQRGGWVDDGQ